MSDGEIHSKFKYYSIYWYSSDFDEQRLEASKIAYKTGSILEIKTSAIVIHFQSRQIQFKEIPF